MTPPWKWDVVKWNRLGRFGRTRAAQLSIYIPIIGYVILFNDAVVARLDDRLNVCELVSCGASWRIATIYYALCAIAVGTIIYNMACPPVVKRYDIAHEFYYTTREFYASHETLKSLFDDIQRLQGYAFPDPYGLYQSIIVERAALNPEHFHALAGVMNHHYRLHNEIKAVWRMATFILYLVGVLLLLIVSVSNVFNVTAELFDQ